MRCRLRGKRLLSKVRLSAVEGAWLVEGRGKVGGTVRLINRSPT